MDYVVVDGVEGAGFGSIKENSYAFSPDGAHVAFVALGEGRTFWVLDGRKEQGYEWVSTEPQFSPDGRRLTYVAEQDGKRLVVIGQRLGEPFDDITVFPRFGTDGRVVYTAKRGAQMYVGVDTTATPYDEVTVARITSTGRLLVVARRGPRWYAIVDGVEGKPHDQAVGPLVTSRDGRRIAYAASRASKELVVTDGVEGPPYDEVLKLSFSPDGRHIVYSAKRSDKYVVVVDGVESPPYDEILYLSATEDMEPTSLTMLARRGQEDLRVVVEWKEKP